MTTGSKCYFNICDDSWWTIDEDGICWGVGETPEEAIDEAEFWGLNCNNIMVVDEGDYV